MAGERIFDVQGYGGGEADSIYSGPKDSFYQGENIEVRKKLNGFTLTPKLEDTGWVFDDDITYMVHLNEIGVNSDGIIVCTENGKIYLNGVLKTTLSTGTSAHNQVYKIGANTRSDGTQYIYYVSGTSFGTGKIHRSTIDLNTWEVSYREYMTYASSTSGGYIGMINNAGLLYIAVNNKIFTFTQSEILTELLVLPNQEEITGFTQFLGNYRIYANNRNTGIQYIWDGYDILPSSRQEWNNQPILGVVNDGANDYAILGFNSSYADLFLIAGTQKQELRVNLEASSDARVLDGYLSIREGIVYISGGLTGESQNYGVYTYGNYFPGTAKSLVQSYSLADDRFTFHSHNASNSYFANVDRKVYVISHNNPPSAYALSGYVTTLMYEGGSWEELGMKTIKIAHKVNGGTINIYARTSESDSFTLIKSITTGTRTQIFASEIVRNANIGNFTEIQFKIELIRSVGSPGTTPFVKRFTSLFDIKQ